MDSINSRGVLGSAGCSCSSQQVIFTVDVAAAAPQPKRAEASRLDVVVRGREKNFREISPKFPVYRVYRRGAINFFTKISYNESSIVLNL